MPLSIKFSVEVTENDDGDSQLVLYSADGVVLGKSSNQPNPYAAVRCMTELFIGAPKEFLDAVKQNVPLDMTTPFIRSALRLPRIK